MMTGKWRGEHTYGTGYPETMLGTSLPFQLEMTEQNGTIKGTATDDEEGKRVFTEPAIIKGSIEKDFIRFTKKYPYFCEIDEQGNARRVEDKPPLEIQYSGHFKDGTFSGEWKISIEYISEKEGSMPMEYAGTWSMQRE